MIWQKKSIFGIINYSVHIVYVYAGTQVFFLPFALTLKRKSRVASPPVGWKFFLTGTNRPTSGLLVGYSRTATSIQRNPVLFKEITNITLSD